MVAKNRIDRAFYAALQHIVDASLGVLHVRTRKLTLGVVTYKIPGVDSPSWRSNLCFDRLESSKAQWIGSIAIGIVSLVGVIGNFSILTCMLHKEMREKTDWVVFAEVKYLQQRPDEQKGHRGQLGSWDPTKIR
jgi:hypothetical protein